MASVRKLPSGRWEMRVHIGPDPLTGKPKYKSRTVDATGKKDASRPGRMATAGLGSGLRRHRPVGSGLLAEHRGGPDLDAFNTLLDAYIDAGGPPEAAAQRGDGLDPAAWAFGWHRIRVIDWYLEQCTTWINDPDQDPLYQEVIRRHLAEALECLHR